MELWEGGRDYDRAIPRSTTTENSTGRVAEKTLTAGPGCDMMESIQARTNAQRAVMGPITDKKALLMSAGGTPCP